MYYKHCTVGHLLFKNGNKSLKMNVIFQIITPVTDQSSCLALAITFSHSICIIPRIWVTNSSVLESVVIVYINLLITILINKYAIQ